MSASQSHGTAAGCVVIPGFIGLLPDDAFTVLIGYTVGPVMWPPLFTARLASRDRPTCGRFCQAGKAHCRSGSTGRSPTASPLTANAGSPAALVLWAASRFPLGHGRTFALYVAAYTVGRFWTEYLRIDDSRTFLGLRLNNWTSVLVFLGAVVCLVVSARRHPGIEDVVRPQDEGANERADEPRPADLSRPRLRNEPNERGGGSWNVGNRP